VLIHSLQKPTTFCGIYPTDSNEDIAALCNWTRLHFCSPKPWSQVRHALRPSVFEAVTNGAGCATGVNVINIGMVSTDQY